jgi:hypothetical protein
MITESRIINTYDDYYTESLAFYIFSDSSIEMIVTKLYLN